MISSAIESVVSGGPADGCRAIDLRTWGGLDLRLLPDRALDCGAAWFTGVPLAWISEVGECAPLDHRPVGQEWRTAWGGGMVTTCGLHNVGAPSEGHGLHGEISHKRARDVVVERGDEELVVRGVIDEAPFVLEREWRAGVGTGTATLRDVCRNTGTEPEPAPFLYHVNIGAPLWSVGARVLADSAGVTPRDADAAAHEDTWDEAPEHRPGDPERVFEHSLPRGEVTVSHDGLELRVRWDVGTLPRLHQWVDPGLGALGIEPANCSVLGRAHDRAEARLPVLAPGEERATWLELRARHS